MHLRCVCVCVCVCVCRHIHPNSGLEIKLDLQLYQIDPKNYLLDFKCVNPGSVNKILAYIWLHLLFSIGACVIYTHTANKWAQVDVVCT